MAGLRRLLILINGCRGMGEPHGDGRAASSSVVKSAARGVSRRRPVAKRSRRAGAAGAALIYFYNTLEQELF